MKTKILLSLLLGALSFQSFSAIEDEAIEAEENFAMPSSEESFKTISTGQYIGGGVASLLLGWGVGHIIQGRYSKKAWIFTAGSAVAAVGSIGFLFSFRSSRSKAMESNTPAEALSMSGAGYAFLGLTLVGAGVRIWELIDVWMLPSHYKVVKKSPFEIKPLAFYDSYKNFNYGLSLKYKF